MQGDQLQEKGEQKKFPLISVRTHFAVSTTSQAEKALPTSLRTEIGSEAQQIVLPHRPESLAVTLKRKQIQKPLHLLKIKKRINTQTGEISHIVQNSRVIKTSYEHQDLCDFISSEGSNLLPSKDPFRIDRNDLLKLIKDHLQDRLEARNQSKEVEHYPELWNLIKPANFLKSYNLAPPKSDLFVNKVKHEDKQLGSYSIGFEDDMPEPSKQIPQTIKDSELFKIISGYLEKRSCWLKNVILATLKQQNLLEKFGFNELKTVLRYLCYTFRNGPWKHTFCAFGFDPRKNYKAVIYQSVSLKLKKKEAEDYEVEVEEQLYDPTFSDISAKYIRSYQLSDIALESIQQILRGKLISSQGQCSKEHGWLSATEHGQILKILRLHKESLQNASQ